MGVILLFGMVARQLGFIVESVQAGFPLTAKPVNGDAAKAKDGAARIEFEYESRRSNKQP